MVHSPLTNRPPLRREDSTDGEDGKDREDGGQDGYGLIFLKTKQSEEECGEIS